MAFDIVWEPHGAYKRFHDVVSGAELVRTTEELHNDARFDDLRYVINDFLDVRAYDVGRWDLLQIRALAFGASQWNPGIRVAIVATEASILALVQTYQAMAARAFPLECFSTLDDARAWASSDGWDRGPLVARPRC